MAKSKICFNRKSVSHRATVTKHERYFYCWQAKIVVPATWNILHTVHLCKKYKPHNNFHVLSQTVQKNNVVIYRVSHELRSLLWESVPYVKIYRYNPKHLCPKLNGYGDNCQRKVLTSCISAYCTSSVVSALTFTEQCSRPLCQCTSSVQRDKIVLHYCQIFMLYVQCLVTLRTTMTWVRVFL